MKTFRVYDADGLDTIEAPDLPTAARWATERNVHLFRAPPSAVVEVGDDGEPLAPGVALSSPTAVIFARREAARTAELAAGA